MIRFIEGDTMKTRIWPVLMLTLIIAVSLAACGTTAPTTNPPTEQPVETTSPEQGTSNPTPFQQNLPSVQDAYPAPAIAAPTENPNPQSGGGTAGDAYPGPAQSEVIDWSIAQTRILNGEVSGVVQTQSLQVTLTLKDGRTMITTEPALDDVFNVLDQCGDPCKDVTRETK
jgi:predicted small lipoprotein YifL